VRNWDIDLSWLVGGRWDGEEWAGRECGDLWGRQVGGNVSLESRGMRNSGGESQSMWPMDFPSQLII